MRYSKGICWIGDCRIPFVDNNEIPKKSNDGFKNWASYYQREWEGSKDLIPNQQGRFTPNLLVCDDMLNDGVITKQSKRTYKPTENMGSLFGNSPQAHGVGIGDSGSSSRYYDLDKWFDKIIDSL